MGLVVLKNIKADVDKKHKSKIINGKKYYHRYSYRTKTQAKAKKKLIKSFGIKCQIFKGKYNNKNIYRVYINKKR